MDSRIKQRDCLNPYVTVTITITESVCDRLYLWFNLSFFFLSLSRQRIVSNLLVGSCITYSSMRTILHRIRNSCFPPIPNSMEELKDSLLNYEAVKEIYKGYAISTNNEIAIIFSTDILLVALAASTEIHVDGTFSAVPRFPHVAHKCILYHTYSIHGNKHCCSICFMRKTY
ncbi:uncharacterized protein [Polyergus mexicanus]|uniref:uncharacterized protein isoform X1 n=1 Tax=Polyergus mexicanus TaxID=615972 RepID=UPI0038B48076